MGRTRIAIANDTIQSANEVCKDRVDMIEPG